MDSRGFLRVSMEVDQPSDAMGSGSGDWPSQELPPGGLSGFK